jgi:hypothetical protein
MLGIEGHSVLALGAFVSASVPVKAMLDANYPHRHATPWAFLKFDLAALSRAASTPTVMRTSS